MTHLKSMRATLAHLNIDAYIIPTADPHGSEYLPVYWQTREWISGFTGSAGTVVLTADHAGLWTDSRYFIQAEQELSDAFTLHRMQTRGPEYLDWILEHLEPGSTVGLDPLLCSIGMLDTITRTLQAKDIQVQSTSDLFTALWSDRPPLPCQPVLEHETIYAGKSRQDKIGILQKTIQQEKGDALLITALDEIAWTLNIRGTDIAYNPLAISYLCLTADETHWFIDAAKLPADLMHKLQKQKIQLHSYESIGEFLRSCSWTTILSDTAITNAYLDALLPEKCAFKHLSSPVAKLKALKNEVEIDNYRNAQKRDGLAMVNFLHWLTDYIQTDQLTELELARKVSQFRSAQPLYQGDSFPPVSAYGPNAALPHYSVSEKNNATLEQKGMYLIDSGGQYADGTTDITRTIALGELSQEEKDDFTRVLKGHIRLSTASFPKGTKGVQLDTLTRIDLWSAGKNFGHGTGHGIGFFLNVHEGPQGISPLTEGSGNVVFEAGMLVTNEPGMYVENKYGIRTENVLHCVEDKAHPGFLRFETLTFCPYDKKLINKDMLTPQEIDWINNYHETVWDLLGPNTCQGVKEWLREATQAL